jgi:hypothetical protein
MVIAVGEGSRALVGPAHWGRGRSRIVLYAWWTPAEDELEVPHLGTAEAGSGEPACTESAGRGGLAKA